MKERKKEKENREASLPAFLSFTWAMEVMVLIVSSGPSPFDSKCILVQTLCVLMSSGRWLELD
jgi:hypothetical protein